jgi:hypothetical protein
MPDDPVPFFALSFDSVSACAGINAEKAAAGLNSNGYRQSEAETFTSSNNLAVCELLSSNVGMNGVVGKSFECKSTNFLHDLFAIIVLSVTHLVFCECESKE